MKKGKIIHRTYCRLCHSTEMRLILDLGYMPHAGDFLTKGEIGKEYYYPLKLYVCKKCGLVQILDVIDSQTLFKNYHYLSTVSLSKHFKSYAEEMNNKYLKQGDFVVEIGSNDGVLLKPLKDMGINVLGIDPSINVSKVAQKKGVNTLVECFTSKLANKIKKDYGPSRAIFANNVLAHIDDINDVIEGINILLQKDGVMVAEVHYLTELIKKNQYDFIYNEHLNYYSLDTFSKLLMRHDLKIFDAKIIKIHSGSVRIYAAHADSNKFKTTKRLKKLFASENKYNITHLYNFSKIVEEHKNKLVMKLQNLRKNGYKIVGYGASGRANTLLNFCGIDNRLLEYVVDESPERYGKYTPGTHIKIVKLDIFRKDKKVKYVLLLAWNYKKDILSKEVNYVRKGGKFIIPLPKITVIK